MEPCVSGFVNEVETIRSFIQIRAIACVLDLFSVEAEAMFRAESWAHAMAPSKQMDKGLAHMYKHYFPHCCLHTRDFYTFML